MICSVCGCEEGDPLLLSPVWICSRCGSYIPMDPEEWEEDPERIRESSEILSGIQEEIYRYNERRGLLE